MRWLNILSPSINQYRKIFLLFRKKKISVHNIMLPGSTLNQWGRAPPNFSSGWGYLGQIDYSNRQQREFFPISFTGQRCVAQNNELLIQISWIYKSCHNKNRGKKRRKVKNNARNNTMALHKYMPDRPIVQFTTSIWTNRISFLK